MSKTIKGCTCTQDLRDLLRAYSVKKDSLNKVTCSGCSKVFWTNTEAEYCFECNAKKNEKQQG